MGESRDITYRSAQRTKKIVLLIVRKQHLWKIKYYKVVAGEIVKTQLKPVVFVVHMQKKKQTKTTALLSGGGAKTMTLLNTRMKSSVKKLAVWRKNGKSTKKRLLHRSYVEEHRERAKCQGKNQGWW